MEFPAKVLDQGKITIPQEVREVLGIDKGDIVRVTISKIPRNTEVNG